MMKNPHSKRTRVVSAAILLLMSQARADEGFGALILAGAAGAGTSVVFSGLGIGSSASGAPTAVLVVVGILAGLSSLAGLGLTSSIKKELVVQLKIDHDTYLAGGERTPFLQEVYRGLLLQTKEYSRLEATTGKDVIDEEKLTMAIDKLVAMVEAAP